MIFTCTEGTNADLIKEAASLYLKKGDRVADITWGKGAFWKKVKIAVEASDINYRPAPYDFTKLPYEDESFDVCVFDPPYVHTPGKKFQKDGMYNNSNTHLLEKPKATEKYHKAVTQRYREGMFEGARIIRQSGFLWVKCQDEVCSGHQWWTHIEVYEIARRLGLFARDLFVLKQKNNPTVQHKAQQHSRKNHSYLWIFEKPNAKKGRVLSRLGIP